MYMILAELPWEYMHENNTNIIELIQEEANMLCVYYEEIWTVTISVKFTLMFNLWRKLHQNAYIHLNIEVCFYEFLLHHQYYRKGRIDANYYHKFPQQQSALISWSMREIKYYKPWCNVIADFLFLWIEP